MIKNYTNTEPHYDNSKEKKKKKRQVNITLIKFFTLKYFKFFMLAQQNTPNRTIVSYFLWFGVEMGHYREA